MPFDAAAPRLSKLGLDDAALWEALRENLEKFGDIADWARLVTGPIQPVIEDSEAGYLVDAAALLPEEPWDDGTWKNLDRGGQDGDGPQGPCPVPPAEAGADRARSDGPELRILLPLIGRKACLDRLAGRPGRRT